MEKYIKILLALSFLWSCAPLTAACAQSPAPSPVPVPGAPPVPVPGAPPVPAPQNLNAKFTGSLFFSPMDVAMIRQAMSGRKPGAGNLPLMAVGPLILPDRFIKISGVFYRSPNDWIVWMNGQKVTPKELLPEIVDIKVKNSSYVSLKWYDMGLRSVISVTMRPRQTYEITTGLIWPENK